MATWMGLEPTTSAVTGRRSNQLNYQAIFGGNNRARTYDPLLVRQMLSQLSYAPTFQLFTPLSQRRYLLYTIIFDLSIPFFNFFQINRFFFDLSEKQLISLYSMPPHSYLELQRTYHTLYRQILHIPWLDCLQKHV